MLMLLAALLSCAGPPPAGPPAPEPAADPAPTEEEAPPPLPWVADPALAAAGLTVAEAVPPPPDAERVEADAWGEWLRDRTLAAADEPVRTHDGRLVTSRAPRRVVQLPLVPGDLQQCADAVLRLRAEWLRETGQEISFHATSGDPIPWARYRDGEVPYAVGDTLRWRPGGGDDWEGYLVKVFTWAGSWSLQEYETAPAAAPAPGMILSQGGFPGHAVLLMDVAGDGDDLYVLVGQSFMPAQSFHLDLGPHGGWWRWQEDMSLGSWTFTSADLREFGQDAAGRGWRGSAATPPAQ